MGKIIAHRNIRRSFVVDNASIEDSFDIYAVGQGCQLVHKRYPDDCVDVGRHGMKVFAATIPDFMFSHRDGNTDYIILRGGLKVESNSEIIEDLSQIPTQTLLDKVMIRCGTRTKWGAGFEWTDQYRHLPEDLTYRVPAIRTCEDMGVIAFELRPYDDAWKAFIYLCPKHEKDFTAAIQTMKTQLLGRDVVFPSRIHVTKYFRNINLWG